MMQDFWDQRYKTEEYIFGKNPNDFFKTFIDSLPPGKILLPGAGEGRNAVYAADAGWEVDAFDISANAREKALRFAQEEGVNLHYSLQDARNFKCNKNHYDVAALIFMPLPAEDRQLFHQRIVECLKPNGGNIYLLAFAKNEQNIKTSGLPDSSLFYSPQELAEDFKNLQIDLLQEEEIGIHEGKGHVGTATIVKMMAIRRQVEEDSDRITI